ncbi:Re/Si-specific NAD(P)(+) transhydrogenase subunit alpha [Pseudomonas iranensis]|uniref:Re/Si-specific NAD(P)(+) transhydrogenase subunit alpha n=1 Tax=Pseudomonas iranensis TaxID=2745503 RepID=UPI001648B26E|nr:Re/Si-specific NAD(P)(+) transhydrogenase subunit alpha [Pseudomonas iranensis]QXI20147.1 Re/Si-specific NAD(P)(+) transhydrogenase subunit alpha [Pseudomonas iranensis]
MKIGIPAERQARENRVAATPESVKKLITQGHTVIVEKGAGTKASFLDEAYEAAGAILKDAADAYSADIVLKVQAPMAEEFELIRAESVILGMLDPFDHVTAARIAASGATGFSLELAPRTSRAQSLDVLSSQSNIAGYKAMMIASNLYQRFVPMLMTAAGTVKAARVLVLGAGVAGLQAIATAKRLGAVVEASDVRPAVKEQIESLGAKFLDVPFETDEEREAAEGMGGYARPMPATWVKRQAELVHTRAAQADIVITTALIPGRPAPTLLSVETIKAMKPGSIVVDLAAGRGAEHEGRRGGNCPLTCEHEVVEHFGVKLVGFSNLASMVATDASSLYARNLLEFIKLITNSGGQLEINLEDDIVSATLLCQSGQLNKKFN